MCGFVACLKNKDITIEDISVLNKMRDLIEHRGPDSDGHYSYENVYMGFKRLSIIDLENGTQPFYYNDDKLVLIFNGEIYNYIEIREKLIEKYKIEFKTESEAEVILAAYHNMGEEFVKELRGMFSFIIWNAETKEFLGARDPFGIKPFYYAQTDNAVYLASELKSLIANEEIYNNNEVDEKSLQNYLTYQYVPEDKTIWNNIKILEPGKYFKVSQWNEVEIKTYYEVNFLTTNESSEYKLAKIREVMEESVRIHMRSDVPVATFLSGGVDSTIVATLASKINKDIQTFTIGFDMEGYDETELALESARELGIKSHIKKIGFKEYIEGLENIVYHLDGPVADPSVVPIYYVCKEAAKHVKVILSGEGADEFFGGYTIYGEPLSLAPINALPNVLKAMLAKIANIMPEGMRGKSFLERGTTPIERRFLGNAKIYSENEKRELLLNYNKTINPYDLTDPYYEYAKNYDNVTKMQYVDINTWLRGDILVKSDRMAMAHSLELRVPFLDKEVLKVASTLGIKDKISHKTTKFLLRDAFKDILPQSSIMRKKLGYPVPIRVWLKDELYDYALGYINNSEGIKYFNKEYILSLMNQHKEGVKDNSRKIWTVLIFLIWHKVNIEEAKLIKY